MVSREAILTGNDDERNDEPDVNKTDQDDLANHKQHPLKQEFQEEWHTNIHCGGRQEEMMDGLVVQDYLVSE